MHNMIADMVLFVATLGMQTYIYTSGIVFSGDRQRASLNADVLKTISSKVTKLIFNIEAASSGTYDRIMGTIGCFEKLKQSIRDTHNCGIVAEAHFVPMKPNISEVKEVIALCRELSVSKLSFLRLVLHGRAQFNMNEIALSSEELSDFRILLNDLKELSDVDIRIGVPLSLDASCHKCEAANGKINIKYNGKVYPCEAFKNDFVKTRLQGLQPQSIYDDSLSDIYRSSQYLRLVREMSREFAHDDHCETCIGQYLISRSEE